jgi:hypothetical protein
MLILLCCSLQLYTLRELPLSKKLELLFEKGLYVLALNLVKAGEGDGVVDEGVVAEIRKRYVEACYQICARVRDDDRRGGVRDVSMEYP